MGTRFAVLDSNLVATYKEIKLFALSPDVYPQDSVDFLYYETTLNFQMTFSMNGLKILTNNSFMI